MLAVFFFSLLGKAGNNWENCRADLLRRLYDFFLTVTFDETILQIPFLTFFSVDFISLCKLRGNFKNLKERSPLFSRLEKSYRFSIELQRGIM